MRVDRRAFLAASAGAAAGLAGCSGDRGGDAPTLDAEPNYRGWFDGVSNYDGTEDRRGENAVSVDVGVEGGLGYYKYGPAAVAVSSGTTVTWEWTGRGGEHDVVALEGGFDSGDPVDDEGATYERAFERPAVYKYYCTPHRDLGMRGAVFVALDD